MFPQITYLDLGKGDKYKIFEPTISDLFLIEYLMESKDNKKENINYIYQILGIDKKFIHLAGILITQVLGSFIKEKAKSGGKNYYLGDLGLLAHHNFMGVKEFMETHYLSNLEDIGNVREYYINIQNNKQALNNKFMISKKQSLEDKQEEEDMIKSITGLVKNEKGEYTLPDNLKADGN